MPTDTEKLVVLLEARVTQFEKNLAKASRTAGKEFDKIERRAKQSGERLEESMGGAGKRIGDQLGNIASAMMAGGPIVAAAAATTAAMKQVASSVAEVGREARKAGVSADTWQRWRAVAIATGATVDGMTDALKELNIRADEFAKTDAGPAAESFARLGYTATEVARKLQNPDAFLDEILGKVRQLDQAAQTRVMDEIFGGTGAEELAKSLSLSVEEMRKIRQEANTLTDEQIKAAEEIDRRFTEMWDGFTIAGKKAILDIVTATRKTLADGWTDFLIPGMSERELADLKRARDQAKTPAELRLEIDGDLSQKRDRLAKALEEHRALQDQLAGGKFVNQLHLTDLTAEIEDLQGEIRRLEARQKQLAEGSTQTGGAIDTLTRNMDAYRESLKKTATTQLADRLNQDAQAAKSFSEAIRELKGLVPELAAELEHLGTVQGIDAQYQTAIKNARSIGQVNQAYDLRERALAAQSIGQLPGSTMDRGKEVYQMLRQRGLNPAAAAGITGNIYTESRFDPNAVGDGGTSAGLFQHHASRRDAMFAFGGRGNAGRQMDFAIMEMRRSGLWDELQAMTDPAAAAELFMRKFERPHKDFAKLAERQEFARTAGSWGSDLRPLNPTAGPQQDAHIKTVNDELARQAQVRKDLNATIQESLTIAQHEQQIAGLTASQQEIERQVFQAELEARREGIELSNQEISQIRQKITETVNLQAATAGLQQTSEQMKEAQMFMAQSFSTLFTDIITGSASAEEALKRLVDQLIQALLQAAFMGSGPFGGLVGGVGLFTSLFGLKNGGSVPGFDAGGRVRGAGTGTSDSILARVSNGEFVVRASQARRHSALLEAINEGRLPAFATGGFVNDKPSIAAPGGSAAPQVSINAPITVNGSAGTPEQNADLARQMGRQLEGTMRSIVADEMRRATRPGNFANQRGRR